jgi:hypothetical protein
MPDAPPVDAPTVVTAATADGVFVGVDPPATPAPNTAQPTQDNRRFTLDDLQKAREQEKSKLYGQIETLTKGQEAMNDELTRLREEREARQQAEQAKRDAAEAEARKQAEDEMDVRALLQAKETEWEQKFLRMQEDQQRDRALLDRERQYTELVEYRNQRVQEMADEIIPELRDLVTGSTPQEIDASLAGLAERSNKIIESATSAAQAARRDMRGTQVTAPAMGPLEQSSGQPSSFTAAEIADMDPATYAKHRASLLNLASAAKRGLIG